MIQSLTIENFRGIRSGRLDGFASLSVLTGPNGCGKSSVLEALQLAAVPGDGRLGFLRRRNDLSRANRWLSYRGLREACHVGIRWSDVTSRNVEMTFSDDPFSIRIGSESGSIKTLNEGLTFLELGNGDPRTPLHQVFTETRIRGGIGAACDLLREVDPTITGLEILTEGDVPILHLSYADRSVPVTLTGDGMQSLVRLALGLSARSSGVFLIEEPEAHQHTAAIVRSAKVIAAAALSGSQVILSTHSMELLDGILASLPDDRVDIVAVYRLRLIEGQLKVLRMKGSEVNAARAGIEDDLR